MSTTINGHTLTNAERRVLNEVTDYMRRNAGDSRYSETTSPKGDGRDVPVDEIYGGHSNLLTADRRTLRRLSESGVLRACEIELDPRGYLRTKPLMA